MGVGGAGAWRPFRCGLEGAPLRGEAGGAPAPYAAVALKVLAYRGKRYKVNLLETHAGVLGHVHDAIASGVSVWGHSTGPAPTPFSQSARRRAPRSAPVADRGSGRSRRAGPQRQTRPEARTHGRARLQAVVLGPEITPHSLWKLWVTRVCEPRALHASGWATRSRRDSTRSRPVRQPPKRSGRPDLRGGAAELSVHDYLLKPGPGVSVCRMAPSALGRGCRRPGFNTHCWQGHKTESRSAHTSQAVGAPGFEPGTSCPPDKRANQAAPRPVER